MKNKQLLEVIHSAFIEKQKLEKTRSKLISRIIEIDKQHFPNNVIEKLYRLKEFLPGSSCWKKRKIRELKRRSFSERQKQLREQISHWENFCYKEIKMTSKASDRRLAPSGNK